MSNIALAQLFLPSYPALPSYLRRSAVAISPRTPRLGGSTNGQTIGTNGSTTTYTPIRSVDEAQAWGADVALWSYTSAAVPSGYASSEAYVSEFAAAGIPIQGTTNTSPVNGATGPFMKSLDGGDWKGGTNPVRPLLSVGGPQNPLYQRASISIGYMPAADTANTQAPKLADIASQMTSGTFGMHMDDPRGPMVFAGARDIISSLDLNSQGCDFSAAAIAGFTTWLGVNTTASQRTAVGLPSNLSGFDIKAWLISNYPSIIYGANQIDPAAVDNYLFRTSIKNYPALRTVLTSWMGKFLRDDHAAYVSAVKSQIGSAPLSLNLWNASPMEFLTWHARRSPQLWDFAVAETAPPYYAQWSAYAVGSDAFFQVRAAQCARNKLNAASCDMAGLRAFFEHKPSSLVDNLPRVVVQLMRQSIMQTVMDGHTPVVPIDIFMTLNDGEFGQGVLVDGYRYWGGVDDYKACFGFIKANGALIDDYEKLATVFIATHNESWPFHSGSPQSTKFQSLCARLSELWKRDVDYHILPVGSSEGPLPQDPNRTNEISAPLIIRLQDDADYYTHLGRLSGPKCRKWSTKAADEAMGHSPVRSTNPYVRASARYNAAAGRVSVHLHNYAMNADGTPNPQTTTLLWSWGGAGVGTVTKLGEASATVDLSPGSADVSLAEYAIVNFAVS